ncbi:hypothetical protein GY45DRAFT_1324034 [Cubamyces sp. BRFM 1775]|nr:hypothetical protein GY45DRAFT_1324034 [Cubamyces sp. BRFM 1775]
MAPSQRFRMTILAAPKDGVSQEEFSTYLKEKHAPLFLSIAISKRNLLKYEQFHVDSKLTTTLNASADWHESGSTHPKFWALAVLEAESPEKILEIFQDEEYLRVVAPDESVVCDRAGSYILAGYYVTLFEA